MTITRTPVSASEFQAYMYHHLPITRHMQLVISEINTAEVRLSAPLAPNKNDKNTAFGGCLAAQLMATGWCWLFTTLNRFGINADVVIQKCELVYFVPVKDEIHTHCDGPRTQDMERFCNQLKRRGIARLGLTPWVAGPNEAAATMEARYVATLLDQRRKG